VTEQNQDAKESACGQSGSTALLGALSFVHGDDGRAYYVRGHVDIAEFMGAVKIDLCDENDSLLNETAVHTHMRVCRDFQEETQILVEAEPGSRGSFAVTWVQDA
jgi:hypothetical protein